MELGTTCGTGDHVWHWGDHVELGTTCGVGDGHVELGMVCGIGDHVWQWGPRGIGDDLWNWGQHVALGTTWWPWWLPALGHGVPVVNVALEGEGHLLLQLVNEIPLGDAGVVWGTTGGRQRAAEGTAHRGHHVPYLARRAAWPPAGRTRPRAAAASSG